MSPKPLNAAKSIIENKKNKMKKIIDSADEVIDPNENKDAKPWWDIFNFSCCSSSRNENIEKE